MLLQAGGWGRELVVSQGQFTLLIPYMHFSINILNVLLERIEPFNAIINYDRGLIK